MTSVQYSLWGGGWEDLKGTSLPSVTLANVFPGILFTLVVDVGGTYINVQLTRASSLKSLHQPIISIHPSPKAGSSPALQKPWATLPLLQPRVTMMLNSSNVHSFCLLYYFGIIFKESYLYRFFTLPLYVHVDWAYKKQTMKRFPFMSRSPAFT